MGRQRLWVTLVTGAALLLAGCGAGEAETRRQETSSTAAVTTTSDEVDVQRFVREHYVALNRGRFEEAFADFGPDLKAELGPINHFKDGYRFTEGTEVKSLDVLERSRHKAVVGIELYADAIDACDDHIEQTFGGTWDVDLSGATPVLAAARIDWTGGEAATEAESECPEPPSKPKRPSWMRGGGDVPATSSSSFCDIHECIPNFDNGNGYRVQCADGTWSQSGGIQGVCSWHGGVG
jgi:hypothetical protein